MFRRRACAAACLAVALVAAGGAGAAAAQAAGRPSVAALQVALRARGLYAGTVDGVRGPATTQGVRRLQARAGVAVDGVAGPVTRRTLGWRGRHRLGSRPLGARARGWDVSALQFALGAHGFPSGPVDGRLGARTAAALARFQSWAGLGADGIAGPGTLSALRRSPPRSPLRFLSPLGGPAGDRFGPRENRFHSGLDYPVPAGTAVAAAGRGCVSTAGATGGPYGNLVVIDHRLGVTTWYAHLATVAVRPGTCLTAGRRIGTVGSTGRSTGPHLHFEIRVRGAVVDPLSGL